MASFSITTAWNETVEFLKRESRLVLPIAFLLVSLPGAALQYMMPTPTPGQPPDLEGLMQGLKTVLLALPVVVVLSLIGTIAISYLAIRPGRTVGEALQVGGRRFIFLLLATLLLGIGAVCLFLPLFALIGLYAPTPPPGALIFLLVLFYLILFLALAIRMMLITPIAAAEEAGPIAIIVRSWALTKGYFWKLLGFLIVFWITALIVVMVISIIFALIVTLFAGPPMPGSFPAFLLLLCSAVVQAVVTSIIATMVARIYVQLAGIGTTPAEVFA